VNKPLTYWAQGNQIDKLCDRFGSTLDELTPREKANLRTVLSLWVSMQTTSQVPLKDSYIAVESAWASTSISEYAMCSEDVIEALSIINGITTSQANEIIRAISNSLSH